MAAKDFNVQVIAQIKITQVLYKLFTKSILPNILS